MNVLLHIARTSLHVVGAFSFDRQVAHTDSVALHASLDAIRASMSNP